MIKTKNLKGDKIRLFYSRYGYKQNTLVKGDIRYKGLLSSCPKHLLEGVSASTIERVKYILVWN